MLLLASIALVVLVVGAAALTVAADVVRRPQGDRLAGLKEWQALVGSVLGFLGAAGVLVLGTSIQAEQDHQQALARDHAIGFGLALEAERIAGGLISGLAVANVIHSQPDQDFAKTCAQYVTTLNEIVPKEKPVWTAALDQMIAFGDDNLSVFVRFYGLYDDLVADLKHFNPVLCERDGKNQIDELERQLQSALDFYRIIAGRYGTTIVEPMPAASSPPNPSDTTTPPPATTNS